jgi:hypothetical protein
MRVRITLIDQNGSVFEGEVALQPTGASAAKRGPSQKAKRSAGRISAPQLDYGLNERAFMKAHGRSLSGQKKFVLLTAYIAKGKVGAEVTLGDIQRHWNRMTAMLGKFNLSYTIRAKENGWVDTKRKGIYVLSQTWKGALVQGNG